MTHQSEWDRKSLIYSSEYSSGIQTPVSDCKSYSLSHNGWNQSTASLISSRGLRYRYFIFLTCQDLDAALNDRAIAIDFKMYADKVKEIDEKLDALKAEYEKPPNPISQEMLQDLLQSLRADDAETNIDQ